MAGAMTKRTPKFPYSKGKENGFYLPQREHPKQLMPENKKKNKK